VHPRPHRAGRCPIRAVITCKLAIVQNARAKGHKAEEAARLVGSNRATLYRHRLAQDNSNP